MAKKQVPAKKSQHGKVHPMNMGDVGKASANAQTGRERKKNERTTMDEAKQRAFEQRCRQALTPLAILESIDDPVIFGQEIAVPLAREVHVPVKKTEENPSGFETRVICGHVIVVTEEGKEPGMPVLKVVASDFKALPASNTFLPVVFLLNSTYKRYVASNELHARQLMMYQALRAAILPFMDEWQKGRQVVHVRIVVPSKGATSAPSKPQVVAKPVTVEVPQVAEQPSRAVALKVEDLTAKPKDWDSKRNTFFVADERGVAVLERMVVGGAPKLKLVRVSDEHELAPLMDEHVGLTVDIPPILREDTSGSTGDMHDVRVARMVVQNYLRHFLVKNGYQPNLVQESLPTEV